MNKWVGCMALTIYTTVHNMMSVKVPVAPDETERHMHLINLQCANALVRVEAVSAPGLYDIVDQNGNHINGVPWKYLKGFNEHGVDLTALNEG